jgi:hypothetical protein
VTSVPVGLTKSRKKDDKGDRRCSCVFFHLGLLPAKLDSRSKDSYEPEQEFKENWMQEYPTWLLQKH